MLLSGTDKWHASKRSVYFSIVPELIGSWSTQRFWATDGNRKCAVFLLTCLHTTTFTLLRLFFTTRDDQFENLVDTTALACETFTSGCRPWRKNVAWFSSIGWTFDVRDEVQSMTSWHCVRLRSSITRDEINAHVQNSKRNRKIISAKTRQMAPTAQQLSAEWASEAEKETESDRLIRKSKQSPFVPIGEFFCVQV